MGAGTGWGKGGRLFEFERERMGWGWAPIQRWTLINFFYLRMGASSRLGAYSNKYGIFILSLSLNLDSRIPLLQFVRYGTRARACCVRKDALHVHFVYASYGTL